MAQQQQVNIADLDMSALQQVKSQLEEVNKTESKHGKNFLHQFFFWCRN